MSRAIRVLAQRERTAYRVDYRRGWRASAALRDGALERADIRNEPSAWYDGYFDYAASRPRYHSEGCTDRDTHQHCVWDPFGTEENK